MRTLCCSFCSFGRRTSGWSISSYHFPADVALFYCSAFVCANGRCVTPCLFHVQADVAVRHLFYLVSSERLVTMRVFVVYMRQLCYCISLDRAQSVCACVCVATCVFICLKQLLNCCICSMFLRICCYTVCSYYCPPRVGPQWCVRYCVHPTRVLLFSLLSVSHGSCANAFRFTIVKRQLCYSIWFYSIQAGVLLQTLFLPLFWRTLRYIVVVY